MVHASRTRFLGPFLVVLGIAMLPGLLPVGAAENPVIRGIQPREAYSGEVVTITGTGFGTATGRVTFEGAGQRLRASTRDWSDSSIRAEVPYGTYPGEVLVRTAAGRTSNGFHFSQPCWDKPVVKRIIPSAAMRCEVVKFEGCGFGDYWYGQELTFNGADAAGRLVGNLYETHFQVRVPEDATSGPVVYTNRRGVESEGYAFRVRDDAPEWEVLPSISNSRHDLGLTLIVEETPEEYSDLPRDIEVGRSHVPCIGCPAEALTVTWHSATTFEQVYDGPEGSWTIEGTIDPVARLLVVSHNDKWQTNPWSNGSTGEEKVCRHELDLTVELPLTSFNVWAPRFAFGADGEELRRRVRAIEYKQDCHIYRGADLIRRDGTYKLERLESAGLWHSFVGPGSDPCRDPNPTWEALGQLHGQVYVPRPAETRYGIFKDPTGSTSFDGFPPGSNRVPLPGVPIRLLRTPPGGQSQELAATVADDLGSYHFLQIPMTDSLQLEITLENHAADPPPFQVTYRRAQGAAPQPVTVTTPPFDNIADPLMTKDVRFVQGTFTQWGGSAHHDDLALTYAHTWQAWKAAGELGLTLDMHVAEKRPLEIRAFSPAAETYWLGNSSVGPFIGVEKAGTNVHINIELADSEITAPDRPMNREWHEFGHHVHADIQGNLMPLYRDTRSQPPLADGFHDGRLNPSTSDSWVEGFAEFYSTLVSRRMARDPQPGLYRMGSYAHNLDVNYTSFSYWGGDPLACEEIAVASLLWDLVDTEGDEDDLRPMGISQDLLDTWGFRFDPPQAPTPVPTIEPRTPVLYGDRIFIEDEAFLFIMANADEIDRAASTRSLIAVPEYPWIFEVEQLYRVLTAMGIGQFPGSHGLTALDELFVAHGFFADTSPPNLAYDPGETIGTTDNARYWVGNHWRWTEVPARSPRFSPAPVPDAYLRYAARDTETGEDVELAGFDVAVTFEPQYSNYDYRYDARPTEAGLLPLVAPDPVYETTLRVMPYADRVESDAPFEVSGEDYWRAASQSDDPALFDHTFDVKVQPHRVWMPFALKGASPEASVPGATKAPATAPSSAEYAADLVKLVNAERARAGRAELAVQAELTAAAEWYASDTALSGEYRPDHTDRQDRVLGERLIAFGYGPDGHPRWRVAENIARGQSRPAEVLADWLASAPHRANLLSRDLCEIGVAHAHNPRDAYGHYWVADFGCRSPGATAPALPSPGLTGEPTQVPSATLTGESTPLPSPTATTGPTQPTSETTDEPTAPATVAPTPVATVEPGLGIQGRVTCRGAPATGVFLVLVHVVGDTATELQMAQTWEGGRYAFASAPSLGAGESYYVKFPNDEGDPSYVSGWYGPDITTYQAGDDVHGGDFDIASIDLLAPADGAAVGLPAEFSWEPRAFGSYSYSWLLYDEAAGRRWASRDLGNVGAFTLSSLPDGVEYGRDYRWYVRIYESQDSFGYTYYWRTVRFTPQPSPTWQTLYTDDFCSPASGWPVGETATERYGYLAGPPCEYQLLLKVAEGLPVARLETTGNFAVEASAYPIGDGEFGLMFGMSPEGDRYYVYIITTTGRYGLYRYAGGTFDTVVPWTESPRIDPDFGNTLRVESYGGTLRLMLDGEILTTVGVGGPYDGWVGVYAQTSVGGFDARYTRFLVEEAP